MLGFAGVMSMSGAEPGSRKVKICGVSNERCAELVLEVALGEVGLAPENLMLGMILWPKSKRSVPVLDGTAGRISGLVRAAGVTPVGVFVDESAATLTRVCEMANVEVAQLHGPKSQLEAESIPPHLARIFVRDVEEDGSLAPTSGVDRPWENRSGHEWMLYDRKGGGTGKTFDWERFADQVEGLQHGQWLLAGGLNPDNVARAIREANPPAVDVAGGVADQGGILKDPHRLRRFLDAVYRL
mmetsp:Transcript_5034/g.10185  ORF Transcript_5034/g.10185 Transcript_5034/m.10185 type:complete len:242 (-) Transcript_5034:502-1227(-)